MRGELFENFIVSEFLKNRYNHVKNNNLYFFRDHVGNEVDLILDYGAELVSVEIKSGTTISNNYFTGIDYYHKLSGEKNKKSIVVYGGEQSMQYKNVSVYSYLDLEKLFNDLNSTE